jgi:hypothetical protein
MNIDRPRQRDAVDREFLFVHAKGRSPGEHEPDERDKTDNET